MPCEAAAVARRKAAGQTADPCVMVIFGASGDLTKRKLVPALYYLFKGKLLPDELAVVGFARREMSSEEFRKKMEEDLRQVAELEIEPAFRDWFFSRLHYVVGNFQEPDAYGRLKEFLGELDRGQGTRGNYFFYLATAPEFFAPIVQELGRCGLASESEGGWRRVIVEKPFGEDAQSACLLNRKIGGVFRESQIYRIDHYLGKETVQNILVFRFSNGIFEPIWNRRYVDHVQITVAEDLGVEQRGGYYDTAGALRDMVPNHIFQLITLTAMEPPISFEADAVRDEQAKILKAIQPMSPENVLNVAVRGQYDQGTMGGAKVPGYRSEPGVSPSSPTETFVALKLAIDNWRWAGVPFYVRTGKRLPRRVTEVGIQFKRAPFILFRETPIESLMPNILLIRIQPDEGISLSFGAKVPGPVLHLGTVDMDFRYQETFGSQPSTGYERLLYDCMLGDATLFQREDMIEAGWKAVQPILDVWGALPPREFPNYAAGTWGPKEAGELMKRDGRAWRKCET
jgi:glucose-6-phosphate 1-dehydrogenase